MTRLALPDIAAQTSQHATPLNWVGMCGIAVPIHLDGQQVCAKADVGVNLVCESSRGIHMSRLYLSLASLEHRPLTPATLRDLLKDFLASHSELSSSAHIQLKFDYLLKRPALVSPLDGWKSYAIAVNARLEDEMFHVELFVRVPYSSTCPCSAALARQLIQQQFLKDFEGQLIDRDAALEWLGSSEGIVATPHSQRSYADVDVRLHGSQLTLPLKALIDDVESSLGTAV